MRLANLVRVARGARGRRLRGVRLVAFDASLMACGRGLLLGDVAGPARLRRRDGVHDRGPVARSAIGVAAVEAFEATRVASCV